MSEIELVIKIDEGVYNEVCWRGLALCPRDHAHLQKAIRSGTKLPKSHGKLKDEDEIFKCIENRVKNLMKDKQFLKYRKDIDVLGTIPHIRHEVKTIIEAESESE